MRNEVAVWCLAGDHRIPVKRVEMEPAPLTLDDGTRRVPGGGYTTFRTFHRFGILGLQEHFTRLHETARLAGMPIELDQNRITTALHTALEAYPAEETRVRVILDFEQKPGDIYLLIEPLKVPSPLDYERGVKMVTRQMQRNNPKAKLTGFIQTAATVRETLPEGVTEAIMVGEDGRLLEGLGSNFFAVLGGEIWTAEQGVLAGITRTFVLEVARDFGLTLMMEGVALERLPELDEAFITSASRAVLPVTQIDGRTVGSGVPGPITLRLLEGYLERVERKLTRV